MKRNQISKDELYSVKEKLSNRLYRTKKTRMNFEERLIETDKFYQSLIIYYSLIISGFSILMLIEAVNWINYFIVLSSIGIIVFSVHLSSQRYSERANEIKNDYTKIAELEIQLELLVGNQLTDINLNKINCSYQELLRKGENHKKIDYKRFLQEKKYILLYNLFDWLYKIFLYIYPLMGLLYIIKKIFFNI